MNISPEDAAVAAIAFKPVIIVTEAAVAGAKNFLGRICNPVADALGEELAVATKLWCHNNIVKTLEKASAMESGHIANGATAHPRVIHHILTEAQWCEEEEMQQAWAGMICSSCSEVGMDDSNQVFINLFKNLNSSQVRLLEHICSQSKKFTDKDGAIQAFIHMSNDELFSCSQVGDLSRIQTELKSLANMGLIFRSKLEGGFNIWAEYLALNLFVRYHGSRQDVHHYWDFPQDLSIRGMPATLVL